MGSDGILDARNHAEKSREKRCSVDVLRLSTQHSLRSCSYCFLYAPDALSHESLSSTILSRLENMKNSGKSTNPMPSTILPHSNTVKRSKKILKWYRPCCFLATSRIGPNNIQRRSPLTGKPSSSR